MSNTPNTNKNNALNNLKDVLFENKVIVTFVILCLACILIADTSIGYIASEVFTRFGRNTCLVLALIIPCLAGLGMNFGIVVGAIAAQISIFWVVNWGFTGIGGFMLCVVMCTPIAIFFGWLLGMIYNNTKGAEMIAGLILGFFADGLYRLLTLYIIGGVLPFNEDYILDRGFGLINAFDLTGNLKYALDDISFLNVVTVLSVVMIVSTIVMMLFNKKQGKAADNKKNMIRLIAGAVLLAFGLGGRMIPIVNVLFGGTRMVFTDAALFGGIGLAVYAGIMIVVKRKKGEKITGMVALLIGGALLAAGTGIAPVREIYQSIRISACTYAIICLFCFFNNWIINTRLGQNMRTVGQSIPVATSAGLDVDKIRIIATCISTVLAAWGQLIFLQNLGTFNTVQQQTNVGLYAIAAILVGGATVQKANNKHAVIGVILFHTAFVVVPLAATKIVGDAAISEYIRMFISYGVIAVSLAMHAWQKSGKLKEEE